LPSQPVKLHLSLNNAERFAGSLSAASLKRRHKSSTYVRFCASRRRMMVCRRRISAWQTASIWRGMHTKTATVRYGPADWHHSRKLSAASQYRLETARNTECCAIKIQMYCYIKRFSAVRVSHRTKLSIAMLVYSNKDNVVTIVT